MRTADIRRRLARHAVTLVLLVSVMAIAAPSLTRAGDCTVPEAATAATLFDDWSAALKTQHPDRITRLFTTDGAFRGFASPIARSGYMPIRDYFLYFLQFEPKARVTTRLVDTGCNFLVDQGSYTWTLKSRTTGAIETREARYHFIYEMSGGKWRISQYVDELATGALVAVFAVPPPLVPRSPITVAAGGSAVAGFVHRVTPGTPNPLTTRRNRARAAKKEPVVDTFPSFEDLYGSGGH